MSKNKYVNTLIKFAKLPQRNKAVFSGDCVLKNPHRFRELKRPCDTGIEIDCDDCIFAKERGLGNKALKVLSK